MKLNFWILTCAIATVFAGASVQRSVYGLLLDGSEVNAVTLINSNGVKAKIMEWGASLLSLILPDAEGNFANVTLGYSKLQDYIAHPQYFGASVGRFANRIAKGVFRIDGKAYAVPTNDRGNALHGGPYGLYNVLWKITDVDQEKDRSSVTLKYLSRDGEMGFPGNLSITATYTLTDSNQLIIDYTAQTDKKTVVNITNHAYWNLGGEGSPNTVYDSLMRINADEYLPVDPNGLPTGEFRSVSGTPFDFRQFKPIGRDVRLNDEQLVNGQGFDHNFVLSRTESPDLRLIAQVKDPRSGRALSLYSKMPGMQFYSGNGFNGSLLGTSGLRYRQGDAFVLEPQIFPDTPNRPEFGSALLCPGQTYNNKLVYQFSTGS